MGLSAKILPNYSYEDYLQWEGKWELIEGIPFAMSPSASPRHQFIAANLITEFNIILRQNSTCNCRIYDPVDIKVSENTILTPDAIVSCTFPEKSHFDFPPELVVEILSPSSLLRDRNTKFELYEEFGIQYYLIVDPESNAIEVYSLINGSYKKMNNEYIFDLGGECQIKPKLNNIWL